MKTPSALAAAMIRKDLKAIGIKARATSENYSMGCSVNVTLSDAEPEIKKQVDRICSKYQYGHFNGMEDIYEYSNTRKDIPQTKYLFVRNEMSDEMKERIYQTLRTGWSGGDSLPPTYNEATNIHFQGDYISQFVWRLFCDGSWKEHAIAA